MAKLYVLSGLTTSGKISIGEMLREKKKDITVLEVDDKPISLYGGHYWETYRVINMVNDAISLLESGKHIVLSGVILPHVIEDAETFNRNYEVVYIFLDASTDLIEERLRKRDEEDLPDKYYIEKILFASKEK